jgi:hypothetical protein
MGLIIYYYENFLLYPVLIDIAASNIPAIVCSDLNCQAIKLS